MSCPHCATDNPPAARFCMGCGGALARRCPGCGEEAPAEARFCMACGAALAAPAAGVVSPAGGVSAPAAAPMAAPPQSAAEPDNAPVPAAEYRQLTVLFSDLVGSTALSEELEPEHLRDILRDYQALASRVVEGFGGHVAKYLGDGLLAYFGYPTAHEDDAQRGVRAGLALLEGLGPLRERALREHRVALRVRIGVHTGPVVAGDMAAGALEANAIVGRTPNVAARLQEIAAPDTLVISEDTLHLIAGYFEVVALGPQTLKGLAEPMALFQVLHESAARTRLEAMPAAQLTPMVGREHEYGLLASRWEATLDGERPALLVEGEAGIGKSRLVRALKEHVAADASAWLTECACSPFHTSTAFYPAIDLLSRVVLRFARGEPPAERLAKIEGFVAQYGLPLAENVPLLGDLLGVPYAGRFDPPGLSAELQRQRTLDLLVAVLLRRARVQPVLFIMEDVHWADPTTVAFLDALLDDPTPARLLVLMTTRPNYEVTIASRPDIERLTVNRLSQGQVARMVERVTGGKRLPEEVLGQIVAKTDGVPLYVEELTKMVVESGLLRLEGDRYVLDGPLTPLAIPSTLQDSLMARLDRLSREKAVAQLGATLGREFGYEVIAAVAPMPEAQLGAALERLVESELVYQRGTPPHATYSFKHALIQDAAYGSLLTSARRQNHARIAQAFEAHFPDIAEADPGVLAHHFSEAALPQQAVGYWLKAGLRALAQSAPVEAIAHLTHGMRDLEHMPMGDARTALDLQLNSALGQAHLIAEGYSSPSVERHLSHAIALCRALGHPPQTVPVTWGLWACYLVRGDYQRTRALSDALLADCEQAGDDDGLLDAFMMAGIDRYYVAEMPDGDAYFRRCAAAYDPVRHSSRMRDYGNDAGMAGRVYHALLLWWLGRADDALAQAREGVALARAVGHPYMIGFTLTFTARLHQMRGDLPAAIAAATEAIDIAVARGFPIWEGYCRIVRGWAVVHEGRPEGMAELDAGLAGWHAMGARIWLPYFLGLKAEACLQAGRLVDARAALDEAEAVAGATGERLDEAQFAELRGALALASGEAAAGEAALREAIDRATAMGAAAWRLRAAKRLAEHLVATCRADEARAVLEPALAAMPQGRDEADQAAGWALLDLPYPAR